MNRPSAHRTARLSARPFLLAAVSVLALAVGCSSDSKSGTPIVPAPDGGGAFPTYPGNVFSIQFRNSTAAPITVWFEGTQPPCSSAEAAAGNCYAGANRSDWATSWAAMKDAFTRSGTAFSIVRTTGAVDAIGVATHVDLAKGEVLRVVAPTDAARTRPEWYWSGSSAAGDPKTAGTKAWVTRTGTTMEASNGVLLYEWNLSVWKDQQIWYDLSGVDGVNANATMSYTKCATTRQKVCNANLQPYHPTTNPGGCPYVWQSDGATVCPNPKLYPGALTPGTYPSWVVPSGSITTASVEPTYQAIYDAASAASQRWYKEKLTGARMAGAPVPDDTVAANLPDVVALKKAYHIWWATNPVGQGWLGYLQAKSPGASVATCDAYGWAFDEKRLILSGAGACDPNTTQSCFDATGNPADNAAITPNINCTFVPDGYLNIDVTSVL